MEKLRIIDYLVNIHEYNGVVIEGNLLCSCSCDTFHIYHTGKQTKGIFVPFLINKKRQLCVKAVCTNCNNSLIIFDSKIDGLRSINTSKDYYDFVKFVLPKNRKDKYKVTMKYNYFPDKLKVDGLYSNDFEECFIDVSNNSGKSKVLIEE